MKPDNTLNIKGKNIGRGHKTYFFADIAANHDGDLERAKDLIYLAAEAGADAAKFQHFQAEKIVSDYGFREMKEQKSHQSKWKKSVFEVYKDGYNGTDRITIESTTTTIGEPLYFLNYSNVHFQSIVPALQ